MNDLPGNLFRDTDDEVIMFIVLVVLKPHKAHATYDVFWTYKLVLERTAASSGQLRMSIRRYVLYEIKKGMDWDAAF